MSVQIAYLDANVVGHIYRRQAGVTDDVFDTIRNAVRATKLIVPLSLTTAEELLSGMDYSADESAAKGRLYFDDLASPNFCIRSTDDLLEQAIKAYARGFTPQPSSAFYPLQPTQWRKLRRTAIGEDPAHAREIVDAASQQIQRHLDKMSRLHQRAQQVPSLREDAGEGAHVVAQKWPRLSAYYAEGQIEAFGGLDVLGACLARGLDGLLLQRPFRAAIGVLVGHVCAQGVNGRKPDRGDHRDAWHVVEAAAAGGVFITHDDRLKKLISWIPDLGMETLTLPELAARL